ncbi:MAG: hypothetical protein HZR80_11125 [Candidatus Heimdallarchaeota archaeon]
MKLIKKDLKRMFLPLALLTCLGLMSVISTPVQAANPGPFFSISILAPNTNPARNQWSTLMVEQLPKIGIAVDVFDHTGWAQIGPRTWNHPGPYPIPSYAEGGFDILFIGYGWGLDFDPTGLFTSDGITPYGGNYYQYNNQEFDWAVGNYSQSFAWADRMHYGEEIQEILYDDQPSICIVYNVNLYAHDPVLDGWDPLLWASAYQPMENWSLGSATELHFAVPADFVDFHPYLIESTYDAQWLTQIYGALVERSVLADRAFTPRLIEDISSSDGLTYNCKLVANAKWADGTAVTTDDVIYTYQLGATESLGHTTYSFNTIYWDNDSVVKIDDDDFTITFLQPYVFQDGNLGIQLLPEHIWGAIAPEDHATQAVTWATSDPNKLMGTGPYYLENWDGTNGVVHLERNPYFKDWYGEDPNFEDIYFEFYSNKEGAISALAGDAIDIIDSEFFVQRSDIEGVSGIDYSLVAAPGNQEMSINMLHPYIGTGELCPIASEESGRHIRKAISHLVPRQVIVDEILDGMGYPGVTHWPKVSIGFDESLEPYEYSINLALEQIEAAGFDLTTTTETTGVGLVAVISILALAGATQIFFLKKRK